jgi:hypothetical protein
MEYTLDVLGAQQNRATLDNLLTPQAVPPILPPRSYGQLLQTEEPKTWALVLPSVLEQGEAKDRGEDFRSVGDKSIRGITSDTHSEEPPAKKQRIQCTACKEMFSAKKSLYRHLRGCKTHCAQSNVSPASFRCDECEQSFSRLDILRRHVKSSHHGQPRRSQQGPGVTTQQTFSDAAQNSQRRESQPQSAHQTKTYPYDVAFPALPGTTPTNYYTSATLDPNTPYTRNTMALGIATAEHQTRRDSQALTTSAAVPDLQSFEYVAISSEFDWTPDQSTIGYQKASISTPSTELTPTTSRLSPASSVREVAITANRNIDDDAELAALADRSLNFSDVPYASANPVSQGKNLRPNQIRFPTPCPLCGDELGNGPNDKGEVKMHLERHKSRMEAITYNTVDDSEAVCFFCQIHFLDIRDFRRHQVSVRTGLGCGFEFDHCGAMCTGHHPRKFLGTYENPDHLRFEKALRHWEGFQRRAFENYFNAYMKGTAPTNARSHGDIPRRRAFAENLQAYSKGMAPTDAQLAYRRSTGSLYSAMSRKSIRTTFTTPVRFRYGGEVKSNPSGVTRKSLADFIRDLAEACANEKLDFVRSLFFNGPLSTLQNVSEDDLRVKTDIFWFYPNPKIERVRCLQFMVEQGLNPSWSSVYHLAMKLELAMVLDLAMGLKWEGAMPLLFEENAPLTVQSRLTQYAFLFAVSQGMVGLVDKLLEHGILNTSSEMPDAGFIQGILHSYGPPPKGSIANASEGLGPCALIMALVCRQYKLASFLLEHGVTFQEGIQYLATSKSAMQHLEDEISLSARLDCLTPLPDYLGLLERRLLAPAIILVNRCPEQTPNGIAAMKSGLDR